MDCGKGASYCNDCPLYNVCYSHEDNENYTTPEKKDDFDEWMEYCNSFDDDEKPKSFKPQITAEPIFRPIVTIYNYESYLFNLKRSLKDF